MSDLKYDAYMAAIHYLALCNKHNGLSRYNFDVGRLRSVKKINDPHQNFSSATLKKAWEIVIWYTRPINPDPKLYRRAGLETHQVIQPCQPIYRDFVAYGEREEVETIQLTFKFIHSFIFNPDWFRLFKSRPNLGEINVEEICRLKPYISEGVYPVYTDILSEFAVKALKYLKLV